MPTDTTTLPPVPSRAPLVAPTAAVLPPPSAIKPVEPAKPAAEMPRPPAARQYGIAIGTYLDRSRAEAELARVSGASGLAGRITPVPQEGVTMYAVLIGEFVSRGAAERGASDLIARGLVDEARIIARAIPPKP